MNSVNVTIIEIVNFYDWLLNISDPRVSDWLLMDAYWPTWGITGFYLLSVYIGMWLMKNKIPFNLRNPLIFHNLLMIILNFHIFSQLLYHSWKLKYNYFCQAVNADPDNLSELKIASAIWWFYISKLVELLDTVFFVLRKKNDQVSFLHVYHHATMFPLWWIGVKWLPGGSAFLGPMINSFVHVVMYSYYGLTIFCPALRKFMVWKKYVTRLQLIQFIVGMIWGINLLVNGCVHIPKWMIYTGIVYGISMISLFLNFYYRAYILKYRNLPRTDICNGHVEIMKNGSSNGHVKLL